MEIFDSSSFAFKEFYFFFKWRQWASTARWFVSLSLPLKKLLGQGQGLSKNTLAGDWKTRFSVAVYNRLTSTDQNNSRTVLPPVEPGRKSNSLHQETSENIFSIDRKPSMPFFALFSIKRCTPVMISYFFRYNPLLQSTKKSSSK